MGGYYASGGMSPEQREQMRQEAMEDSHQEGVQENQAESAQYEQANQQFPLTTDFHAHGLDSLKSMLSGANPGGVQMIGENWKKVHNRLVGEDGSGTGDCAHGMLKKAVDDVLEHWEGKSANQFQREANSILLQMRNTATHCNTVSQVMTQMSSNLSAQQPRLAALEQPGWFDSAWDRLTDSGRDDKYTQEDVQNKNLPKDVIADINEGYLSEGKEVQLQAVAVMETLARTYVGGSQRLKSSGYYDGSNNDIPPSNPTSPMPTPVPAFSGSTATPSASRRGNYTASSNVGSTTPNTTGPRDHGITGGKQVPYSKTQLDTVKPGLTGPLPNTPPGGGPPTTGPTTTGPSGPHTTPNLPGGGALRTTPGGGAKSTGPRGGIRGAGPGTGAGKNTASGGFRGMAGGGAGGGGRGGIGKSGGRGPLARAKGGVAGAPRGIVGGRPATPGGTGLGKGRGGASGKGSGKGRGMLAGAARGSNQRPGEEENEQLARPDYLVEDEETWTPEDNRSTPGTIE